MTSKSSTAFCETWQRRRGSEQKVAKEAKAEKSEQELTKETKSGGSR
jgi:hypothetical protein